MTNLEQDEPKLTGEITSGESAQGQAGSKFIRWLDTFLDKLYRNRRDENPPNGINGQIWGMPSTALSAPWASDSPSYFLHYFQSRTAFLICHIS